MDSLYKLVKKTHLHALKQQELSLQLVEPIGVDYEHDVVENVSAAREDKEELASELVGPGPGKQGVNKRRNCLKRLL